MQPIRLYFSSGRNGIPETIVLGENSEGNKVTVMRTDVCKHTLFRGQSGAGKSYLLALYLMEFLAMGHRVIFIDPLGEIYHLVLHWHSYLCREAYLKGDSYFRWFSEQVLQNTLFMDLSQKDHPFRHNMLKPFEGEDISDVISRQIKFFDAFLSSSGGDAAMDSQLQRRSNYVALISIFAATNTSLEEGKKFVYNREWREILMNQAEQRSPLREVREAVAHFRYLDQEFKGRVAEKLNSLETALSPFFENPCVRNFLLTSENNVNFPKILNHQSLFIKTPISDIPVRKLLFNYLYTVFFTLSEKRTTDDPVFLGSDESALVFNNMMADYICRIRNYKVYLINSHQSLGQMFTEEGMKIAKTIESQSRIRFYFRHDAEEAKEVAEEIGVFYGKTPKQIEITQAIQKTASQASSNSVSESKSNETSVGTGQSIGESVGQTSTQSFGISDSIGITQSLSKQWSEAETLSDTVTIQSTDGFTYSENLSRGRSQLKGNNITFTQGEGKSVLKIETESGSVSIAESEGVTETNSTATGYSEGTGTSQTFSSSDGAGSGYNYSTDYGGHNISIIEGAPVSTGHSQIPHKVSQSYNNFHSAAQSNGTSRNSAFSSMKSAANSLSKAINRAKSQGVTTGNTSGLSAEEAISIGRQISEGENFAKTYARAIQTSLGQAKSFGKSTGFAHSIGESTSRQIARATQQAESIAQSIAHNYAKNVSQSKSEGITQSQQHGNTLTVGESLSISWKLIFYTIQEEKELLIQEIKTLQPRYFYLSIENQPAIKVKSETCSVLSCSYGDYNFLKILSNFYQHYLLQGITTTLSVCAPKENIPDPEPKIYSDIPLNAELTHFFPKKNELSKTRCPK